MNRAALACSVLLFASVTAYAGKGEREYYKSAVAPAIKLAESTFNSSCGCALKITIASSTMVTENDLYVAKHVVDSITRGAPDYCTDAVSKKAACTLRSLDVGKADKAAFTFQGGKGLSVHDGQLYLGWDQIMRELDK